MCDEMERSLHDALCVVKRVLESKSVVTGGGAVEAALSIYLENYATSMVSRTHTAANAGVAASSLAASRSYVCLRPAAGLSGTVGHRRVRPLPPHHPQDAGRERGTGLH